MQEQSAGGLFSPGQKVADQPKAAPTAASPDVSWTASEFVEHQKPSGWYGLFSVGALVLVVIIYFVTRDWLSSVATGIFAILFIILSARKPRVLQYTISNRGVQIGQKLYPIGMFRSFAIVDEGALHSVSILPLKRIMPPLNVYFAPEDEPKIVESLGSYLPQEQQRRQDPVDRLMRKIRF